MTNPTGPAARPKVQVGRWSASAILAAAFIVGWLVVQLLTPALVLLAPRQSPFGWQMYSSMSELPDAWTVGADGTLREVDVQALFTVLRAEIDYVAALRAGLCKVTDADAVVIQAPGAPEPERVPCR
jgi:hypothetical protein